jgi:hypothetical protein
MNVRCDARGALSNVYALTHNARRGIVYLAHCKGDFFGDEWMARTEGSVARTILVTTGKQYTGIVKSASGLLRLCRE